MKSYKKIVVSKPGKISVEEVNYDLSIEDAHDLIIENIYSHISAGTELACLDGLEDWFKMPATPGYTSIGRVVEKGKGIDHVGINDLVYTFGPHAAYFKINTNDRWHGICVKLPENINLTHAAFTHMAGIAISALRKSKIELGDWVAVSGLGAIGNMVAQLTQLQGANVIAFDMNDQRLALAQQCNIQHVHNSKSNEIKDTIVKISGQSGVSTFIDATGVPAVIEKAASCITLYGELILLGSPRAEYKTNLTSFLQKIHLWSEGAIEVKGALEFTYPTHQQEFIKHSIERNSKIILQLIAENKLIIAPLVSHTLSINDVERAYNGLRNQPETFTGVVFNWEK